jgi:hypothetical protein
VYKYQQQVGSITYCSIITRADNAYPTLVLASYNQNPGPNHHYTIDHNLGYLLNTQYFALKYRGDLSGEKQVFIANSNISFIDDPITRVSIEGFYLRLFCRTIDWKYTKQSIVITSIIEAELKALAYIYAWLLWWGRFFYNINLDID